MGGGQGNPKTACDQQHQHVSRAAPVAQKLGMPGERDTRLVDDRLLHRTGDQRLESALQAAVHGAVQGGDDGGRVGRIQRARLNGFGQRHRIDVQATGAPGGLGG